MAVKLAFVDDSEVALEWAREKLTPLGFEVVTYSQSLGIQVFVRRHAPDVLLLDVRMPALNGDTLCKMLKQNPDTKDVLIALYSGLPEDELRKLTKTSGADGFVQKTEDVYNLVAQIEDILKNRGSL